MTTQEMTQLFALMSLAWPNAPMFRKDKIRQTIILWTVSLPEVDFLTGKAAVIRLCREREFPPTIAAMKEAAESVLDEIDTRISNACYLADAQRVFQNGIRPYQFKQERRRELLEELARNVNQLPEPKIP